MRKNILLAATIFTVISSTAQKINQTDVPATVTKEFSTLYPDIKDVKWIKVKSNYEARFYNHTTKMNVTIDASGKLLETETLIATTALPTGATDYITKNLSGKKIHEVYQIKDTTGKVTYEVEIDEVDYIFDDKGAFLKKEADKD